MKKAILFVLIIMTTVGCSSTAKSTTTSYLSIIDKGITGKELWVNVTDPNAKQKKQFKIVIDDENYLESY